LLNKQQKISPINIYTDLLFIKIRSIDLVSKQPFIHNLRIATIAAILLTIVQPCGATIKGINKVVEENA
jgi:hypothetical protein